MSLRTPKWMKLQRFRGSQAIGTTFACFLGAGAIAASSFIQESLK
jgi:hypothetical protein